MKRNIFSKVGKTSKKKRYSFTAEMLQSIRFRSRSLYNCRSETLVIATCKRRSGVWLLPCSPRLCCYATQLGHLADHDLGEIYKCLCPLCNRKISTIKTSRSLFSSSISGRSVYETGSQTTEVD